MTRDGDSDPLAETRVPAALLETAVDSVGGKRSLELGTQIKIGRFVVLEKLGEGGMGLVVAAFDPQLDRRVAIKMLHDHVSESQGARLEREAKAMAQLSHPNVVTIHETGLFGDRLYIAMEHVEGTTLAGWLRAAPRTTEQILDLVIQAGRGLAAAHAVGLVHRDFKPDNVLVGNDGRVRVSDFGLVSSAGEPVTVDGKAPSVRSPSALTQTGAVMGTPLYMAPEQHDGRAADAKADQFSFCVTLWQALCDDLPYGAETYDQLVANVTGGKLRPVPRGVRVSARLRAILARGLAADPAARYPSMQALLSALERARRRPRWPWLVGGGAAIAGAAVLATFALRSSHPEPCAPPSDRIAAVWNPARAAKLREVFEKTGAPTADELAKQIADAVDRFVGTWGARHVEVCRATRVRGEQSAELLDLRMRCLDGRLAELDALLARFAETTSRDGPYRALDAAAALPGLSDCDDAQRLRAAIPLPADPELRAKIDELEHRFAEAASFDKVGNWARARELVVPAAAEAKTLGFAPLEAKLVLLRAGEELHAGDLGTAEQSYRDAADAAARAKDDDRLAQAWIDLMSALAAHGNYAGALELAPIARTSTARVDQPRLGARFANALAGIYLAQGKYAEAKEQYAAALDFVKRDGPASDLLGPALANLGTVQWYLGDTAGAKQYFEQARARLEATLGPRHPTLGYIHRNLGDLASGAGDLDGAIAHYLEARAIFEGAHGPDHIDVAIALEPLCYAYARKGEAAKAREAGERALALREAKLGPDHPSLTGILDSLADADVADGSPAALARALQRLDRSIAIRDKALGPDHPKTPETLERLATVAGKLGKPEVALAALRRSATIRARTGPSDALAAVLDQLAVLELPAHRADGLRDYDRAVAAAVDPLVKASIEFGRAKALGGTAGIAAAKLARERVPYGPAGQPLLDQIDAWLATR